MKMLVGFDGSEAAKAALMAAIARARSLGACIFVVCIRDRQMETDPGKEAGMRHDLDYARTLCGEAGVACETRLLDTGPSVGENLVRFARENAADEMIIGIKKRSRVEKLLLGSTAQYVILKAPCPVLAVK